MFLMILEKDGETTRIKASGWTEGECESNRKHYEAKGYTVRFDYGVWG